MKYKNLYKDLKIEYSNLEYSLQREKEKVLELEGQLTGIQEGLKRLEGRESYVLNENEWLKETLRLVVVPEGREAKLAKLLEKEREKRIHY